MFPDFSPAFFDEKYPAGIPADWSWSDISKISKPKQWPTISQAEMTESGYPVYGANGKIGFFHTFNHIHSIIAISCRGSCGDIHWTEPNSYVTGNAMCLEDIANDVDQRYLYFALLYRTLLDAISGSAQPQITRENLRGVFIPFPPLPEQKKIAAILTSVDDVIESTQKQIDKLQDLKKATMNELLTKGIGHTEFKDSELGRIPKSWEVKVLGEMAHVQSGVAKNSQQLEDGVELPYLRVANVQDGFLDLSEIKMIVIPKSKISRFLLKKGDVLMNEGGDFDKLGRGTIWQGEIEPCVHQNHVFAVRTNQEILLPEFLNFVSEGTYGKRYFIGSSKQSTNLASINSSQLKAMPIAVPPLKEQVRISDILTKIRNREQVQVRKLTHLQSLKKSLMQDLLTGKVRVKVD